MILPTPPPDGGFLILNDAQIDNFDLVCAIKSNYPRTKIYAQSPNYMVLHRDQEAQIRGLSREARRVLAIGNPRAGPSGMVGYFARNADLTLRGIRDAVDKMNRNSRGGREAADLPLSKG